MQSSTELERLFLLWKGADTALVANDLVPARVRVLYSENQTAYTHLVEGGRWFFTVDHGAGITYYDLDAETLLGTTLVPHQMSKYCPSEILMSVDYDTQSPTLKFTIALYLFDKTEKHVPNRVRGFQVWGVSLLLDSSKRGIGLVATLLSTFPHRAAIRSITSISIFGPYLAFIGFPAPDRFTRFHVFVVRWMHVNGQSDNYPLRMLQSTFSSDVSLL